MTAKKLTREAIEAMSPLPGTAEAIMRGCNCTVASNKDGNQNLSIKKTCPVHGHIRVGD
jgi:hypothetical protein